MSIVFVSVMISSPGFGGHLPFTRTIFEKNSLYQYIMVDDDHAKGERYVLVNTKRDRPQGGISLADHDRLLYEYTRMAFTSLVFLNREPADVLFVGLGAGVMPRWFNRHYPEVNVDVVEIDPVMVDVAKKFFYFREKEEMKVHVRDGRTFIKRTKNRYDLIFLDAYRGENIPFHLTTVEFLREVKRKLKQGGVVASNILSKANNKYFWSMVKTYRKEFEHLYVFKGEDSSNFIFVATANNVNMEKGAFLSRAGKIQSDRGLDINLGRLPWDYGSVGRGEDAKILTDDFAPVNLYKQMESGD